MYKLERARKCKIAFIILTLIFFALSFLGFGYGGSDIILTGFMLEPLPTVVMLVSLLGTIVCLIGVFVVDALEKDIAEWLEILETRINRK